MLDANYFLTLIYHIDILTPVVNLLPKGVLIMRRILEDVEKKLARLERNAEAIDREVRSLGEEY